MQPGILGDVRVVQVGRGIAGSVATLLLAEAGADVVLVEPPGGSDDRGLPGFRTWNRSKRSVVLDLTTADGDAGLHTLLAAADVLVHDHTPAAAAALGLDDAALAARHPHLVVSSITAWPVGHADADRPVDELLAMARLGVCDEQQPVRRDGPCFVRFPLGSWGAAYLSAIGVLARLSARLDDGAGGVAHTSLVQGALVPLGMLWRRAETPSPTLAMGMPKESRGSQATLFECADGVWLHLMGSTDPSPLMQKTLAELEPDETAPAEVAAFAFGDGSGTRAAFLRHPSATWLADLWAHDIPCQPALAFGEVLGDEQARLNGYVIELDDPEAGRITVPGCPVATEPAMQVQGPAPEAGAHTAAVLEAWGASPRLPHPDAPVPSSRRYPLEGLKVLDLGAFLAGPYGPMVLADLGADVIKVEPVTGDGMRAVEWAFAGCQRGKRSVALDLKSPDARHALEALVRWADVVHHNLRMPAARRLGIDEDTLRLVNPDIVYCHASSYGPDGPRAEWPGYDQLFQAQCGWEALGAGEGNPPMWHRFGFMDHQCALASVVGTLLALHHRDLTGEATGVAASLLGAGVLTTSEAYRRPDGTLTPVARLDADQTRLGPGRRLVQVADGWVAIAADRDHEVAALLGATGAATPDEIDGAVAASTAATLLQQLATAGVAAEQVRLDQAQGFFDDPAHRAAGLVASYPHADWGQLEQPGALWSFGNLDVRLELAPPGLGQHTAEVLAEIGLPPEEIERLAAAGAIGIRR